MNTHSTKTWIIYLQKSIERSKAEEWETVVKRYVPEQVPWQFWPFVDPLQRLKNSFGPQQKCQNIYKLASNLTKINIILTTNQGEEAEESEEAVEENEQQDLDASCSTNDSLPEKELEDEPEEESKVIYQDEAVKRFEFEKLDFGDWDMTEKEYEMYKKEILADLEIEKQKINAAAMGNYGTSSLYNARDGTKKQDEIMNWNFMNPSIHPSELKWNKFGSGPKKHEIGTHKQFKALRKK